MSTPATLTTQRLSLGYRDRAVVHDLDLTVPPGSFTVLIGPNGCGKSTVLKGLARVIRPLSGRVLLDGRPLDDWPTRAVARRMAILPQRPAVPDGITILDLVRRGRHPHRGAFARWSPQDEQHVTAALGATALTELADRSVGAVSGGQLQRAFIAMVLAQDTPLMLLDEPTTFLDIAHQLELLELCRRLNLETGRTLVVVLHDLDQAARYATHLVALDRGRVVAQGSPAEVLTAANVRATFGIEALIVPDPITGTPMVVPDTRGRR
ncbi:MAG TPA: ABC transporter ATP-binding protein [Cellulomonas sp.]